MTPPDIFFKLNLYDSKLVTEVKEFTPGVHVFRAATAGNSILSTLWVKSAAVGASVKIRYYDIGPGGGVFPGERIDLAEHRLISTSDTSDRKLVTRLHNKIFIEAEVTGGNVEFGIYITVVGADPQIPPYLNGQEALLSVDGGDGLSLYDPTDNKFYLATATDGGLDVNIKSGTLFVGVPGDPFTLYSKIETDGSWQTIISETVPAGKKWRLLTSKIVTPCYGECDILVDGDIINSAVTSPGESNVMVSESPYYEMLEGQTLEVKFKKNYGPNTDISAVLKLTSVNA